MPTTPLERLLFAQGGKCFFCEAPLPRAAASVEHLVASANGGGNGDGNCVACCKAVNALLGSMSLKEKFRVVLNQRGSFKCPNGEVRAEAFVPALPAATERYESVVANLRSRGSARPRTLKTLRNSVAALFQGISPPEVESLIAELKASGKLIVNGTRVSYALG